MCLETYEIDPAQRFSAQGLAWQAAIKKTTVTLGLLTDVNMLIIVEKILEEDCVMLFIDMRKLKIKTWKGIIKLRICQ